MLKTIHLVRLLLNNSSSQQKSASLSGLSDCEVPLVKSLGTVRKAVIDTLRSRSLSSLSGARARSVYERCYRLGLVAALRKEVGRCYRDSDNVKQRGEKAARIPGITRGPNQGHTIALSP